jgi:hypothetical protein
VCARAWWAGDITRDQLKYKVGAMDISTAARLAMKETLWPWPLFCLALLTASPLTAQPPQPLAGPAWPAYKGNAGLTGMSSDDSIRPPFKLAWSYRLDGDASSDAGAGVTTVLFL